MKNLKNWLYYLMFIALNFPVKVFAQGVKYGPSPMPNLYGTAPYYGADNWYVVAGRWLLFPIVPIAIILIIIIFIIKRARNKK